MNFKKLKHFKQISTQSSVSCHHFMPIQFKILLFHYVLNIQSFSNDAKGCSFLYKYMHGMMPKCSVLLF